MTSHLMIYVLEYQYSGGNKSQITGIYFSKGAVHLREGVWVPGTWESFWMMNQWSLKLFRMVTEVIGGPEGSGT